MMFAQVPTGPHEGSLPRELLNRIDVAVQQALPMATEITHVGFGAAEVKDVASNRRILGEDGTVRATRYTTCRDPLLRAEPAGVIDPELSSLSFWNEDQPVAVLSYYACHPQSYYRTGVPSPDFPGIARFTRGQDVPDVLHVHFNGAGGNIGAGKYNDGSKENRLILAGRVADGMKRAFEGLEKFPVTPDDVGWTIAPVALPPGKHLDRDQLRENLSNWNPKDYFGSPDELAWLLRCESGHKIELTCLRIGDVRILHMPGELFVEYQLSAKAMRPDLNVAMAAYGDYGPGYIGTEIGYSQGGYETSQRASNVDRSRTSPALSMGGLLGVKNEFRHACAALELSPDHRVARFHLFLGGSGTGRFFGRVAADPSTEPADTLQWFIVAAGFQIELVAAEPLISSPVAIQWDAVGRLYVCEMRGYSEDRDEGISRITRLEDHDDDGVFDTSTVFADGLLWPTAIFPFDDGLFVGDAPNLYYFKDTDGDGKADAKTAVLTGFGTSNVQGLMNSMRWGLDNRIHIACSSVGGEIRRVDDDENNAINVRGRDLALDPRTFEFALTSGAAQHGMCFDDVGRKFVSSNSDHIQQVMYEDRYIARNPLLSPPASRVSIAADGPQAEVFRTSPVEPWRIVRTRLRVGGKVPGPIEGGGRAAGYFTAPLESRSIVATHGPVNGKDWPSSVTWAATLFIENDSSQTGWNSSRGGSTNKANL